MPDGFRCPNPTCSHVFSPAAVKGAAALKCPRCGSEFQFRSGRAATPTRPTPAAQTKPIVPVGAPAVAPPAPVAPAVPASAPAAAVPVVFAAVQAETPSARKYRRRRHGPGYNLVVVLLVISACVTASAFLVRHFNLKLPLPDWSEIGGQSHESSAYNYRLVLPANWKLDDVAKRGLH